MDSLYSSAKKYATQGYTIPIEMNSFLENNLKWIFALHRRLPIEQTMRYLTASDFDASALSLDYYSFLEDIDYESILEFTPILSPFGFFSSILKYYPNKIDEIGETPVRAWINEAKFKLSKTIKENHPLFYELLAATSYSKQLKSGTPLSQKQITNIKEGFDNGLSHIILNENGNLLEALTNKLIINDLSDIPFDLEEYLSYNLTGIPTVVDLWNTWCGPCQDAQKIIKKSLSQNNFPNIVFLYICDTSSSDQWKNISQEFHGNLSLRINEESMQNIMNKYNIDGFPGYLFCNRNNKIIEVWTGFHGIYKLYDCMDTIKNEHYDK